MNSRISSIDGWRAIAAIGVLFTHTWALLKFPTLEVAGIDWMRVLNLWGNGVHLFFVISGFCFYLVLSKQTKYDIKSVISFWKKRWLRVAPAFYVVCFVSALSMYTVIKNDIGYRLIANIAFLQNHLPGAEIEAIFWSLAVEWHFYLLLPLIFIVIRNFGVLKTISTMIVAGMLLNLLHYAGYLLPGDKWWYTIFANLQHFGWGILLGYLYKNNVEVPALLKGVKGLIIGLFIAYFGKTLFSSSVIAHSGSLAFLPQTFGPLIMTFGFGLMILNTLVSSFTSRILSSRLLAGIGRISYSFYLWHSMLLSLVFSFTKSLIPHGALGVFVLMLLVMLVLLPVSYVSYKYLEAFYFRRRQKLEVAPA